ncbi:MAG: DEAD/DEAH box helicase [Bacteroidales bacterium]|nr:DEAD/DEAH box helicase [Bacteroidales bacterium]
MNIIKVVTAKKSSLIEEMDKTELAYGEIIFHNGNCQILSQSPNKYELIVSDDNSGEIAEYMLNITEDGLIFPFAENSPGEWDRMSYACLLQIENELQLPKPGEHIEHKKYTREGMIRRVLKERRQKAETAKYRIKWAPNIYGDHILTNDAGVKYKVFLRNFENETGYSDSMDARINKLGTTKHIMFAFKALKENDRLYKRLNKTYPFIEIFCDPLNDYKITWHYPHKIPVDEQLLISRYFKNGQHIENESVRDFLGFIEATQNNELVRIRPEVREKLAAAFEEDMLLQLKAVHTPDYSDVKIKLFDYQKEGIEFVLFKKAAIIADEMGLGKTIQAIAAAILKKKIFDFKKTLVVCPASLKEQWKNEIEKFSTEKAIVIQGTPEEREAQYMNDEACFFIVNYETVLRDQLIINDAGIDFMILDEAQRAKNFETKTAGSLKRINTRHILVITGTPIENRLIDIFSIMSIIDPEFLGPLWEFSYQHCLFDPDKHNKINGYYNLQKLNKKLNAILLRREKRKVIEQLPNVQQINVPVSLSPLQADYHASYARGIAKIIGKKYMTPYDLQHLQMLLANMRMVCDSTYLIDDQTNESPKLGELEYMLVEKMDLKNKKMKIIIFSEWVKVHKLLGRMLRENNIGFVELSGKIPVKARGELIRKFETNPNYKVFLSTEAGGSGLNLQIADTLINFELPWNPAKKNQRIGRIDRLGQKSNKLTIINFITRNSIETQIASGLLVKQSLFDGVLGEDAATNFVDFSSKGRSQFIDQLEDFIRESEKPVPAEEFETHPNGEIEKEETTTSGSVQKTQSPGESIQKPDNTEIDLSEDSPDEEAAAGTATREPKIEPASKTKTEELEEVMNNGMQFLSGLFRMTTGKDMGTESQKIEIDKKTGEVVMRFKIPI